MKPIVIIKCMAHLVSQCTEVTLVVISIWDVTVLTCLAFLTVFPLISGYAYPDRFDNDRGDRRRRRFHQVSRWRYRGHDYHRS